MQIVSEIICMKCQILFPGKNKKNIIILSAAELAKRMVNVKGTLMTYLSQAPVSFAAGLSKFYCTAYAIRL